MMAERQRPPGEFIVDEKKRSRFQGLQSGHTNKYNNPSVRSFASSITWSEVDDCEIDGFDPFCGESFEELNDQQPGIPQRRSTLASVNADNLRAAAVVDVVPSMPYRQQSNGLMSVSEENLKAISVADAAPCKPSRQESLASSSHHHRKERKSNGSGSSSTAEPVPEYLQPTFCEDVESKLKELSEKAEEFKRVVDIRDRPYGVRTYKQCFVGSEAVDRMIESGLAKDREEAVELGQNWMRFLGLFRHVCDDHEFKDKHLFYKFADSHSKTKNKSKKLNSAQPTTGRPWYSVRGRDTAIMEGQPMSQKDLSK